MVESRTLDNIILNKSGLTNLQVVSVDIVKFSLRRTRTESAILQNFTSIIKRVLKTFSMQYNDFSLNNGINLSTDLIKIPTGDGFILAMPLEGLPKAHLDFSIELLKQIHEYNKNNPCPIYDEKGWCNCKSHSKFDVRIGIDEGQALVFKDLNDNYNVIGNTINMTSRIMDLADGKTILLGENAYKNIIDIADLEDEECDFVDHGKIKVKNEVFIGVHQYCPKEKEYIISNKPNKIQEYQFEKEEKEKLLQMDKIYTDAITSAEVSKNTETSIQNSEVNQQIVELKSPTLSNYPISPFFAMSPTLTACALLLNELKKKGIL
jgi:hypothetical protein